MGFVLFATAWASTEHVHKFIAAKSTLTLPPLPPPSPMGWGGGGLSLPEQVGGFHM